MNNTKWTKMLCICGLSVWFSDMSFTQALEMSSTESRWAAKRRKPNISLRVIVFFVKFRLGGWALKYILLNTCTIHLYIERHKDGRGRYALEFWYAETQTEYFLCLRSLCLKFRFRRYIWFDCVHHMEFSYICICISCPIKRI